MPIIKSQQPGPEGIKDTLTEMSRLVNQAVTHPLIRKQAMQAIVNCAVNDKVCQQASILAWVQRSMKFIRDPYRVEALHDPVMVAMAIEKKKQPYGDCDDFSMYLASLLRAVGLPASFKVVGFNGGNLSHVYVEGPKGERLDATRNPWVLSIGEMLPETSSLIWRF